MLVCCWFGDRAIGDRRHNLNPVVRYEFSRVLEVSASSCFGSCVVREYLKWRR